MQSLQRAWALCMVGAALLLAAALAAAQSPPELKILATDPALDALLARNQPYFVRFEVKSAAPVAVSAHGLFKGNAVLDDGGASAPAMLPAGGGMGVVSFFYWGEKPTRIDEVRLKISDAQSGAQLSEYAFPVALTWLADDAPPREPAPWVKEWQQAQAAARAQGPRAAGPDAEQFMGPGVSAALAAAAALLAIALVGWRRRARADDGATRR
jgi:hypothetical protein